MMKSKWFAALVALPLVLQGGEYFEVEDECDTCEWTCPPCDPCEMYCGGWIIGFNHAGYVESDWNLMIGYYGEHFLFDIGYGFDRIKLYWTGDEYDLHEINGHLGVRSRVGCENLFFTFGLLGAYRFRNDPPSMTDDPFEVGAFLGLDYQLSRHFLISGKIAPYAFERLLSKDEIHHVFTEGSISFAYVF